MKYISILFIALICISYQSNSQCCSVGSPVSGTTNVGTVSENSLRISAYYKYGYSNEYYAGTKTSTVPGTVDYMSFNVTGLSFGYGITDQLTVEAELGYYVGKKQQLVNAYTRVPIILLQSSGLSNGGINLKYNILNESENSFDLTLGAGYKFPFSTTRLDQDGTELPIDLQTSTLGSGLILHAFLKKRIEALDINAILINRTDINFENTYKYIYGNSYVTSLSFSGKIMENFMGILQIRNEIREVDKITGNSVIAPSGSFLVYLSPQLSYNMGNVNLSVFLDLPVYRDYKQRQIANKFGTGMNMSYLLDF